MDILHAHMGSMGCIGLEIALYVNTMTSYVHFEWLLFPAIQPCNTGICEPLQHSIRL